MLVAMTVAILFIVGMSVLIALLMQGLISWNFSGIPHLRKLVRAEPDHFPRVSLIVPACNEEEGIEGAMRSLLSQDYPNLEIIAINDRSTDQTGAILTRLAATHRNLSVVEIPTLPEGWLGKVHAMAVGSEKAEGEYLLFMDADVHMTPGTLKKCMSWVLNIQDMVNLDPAL